MVRREIIEKKLAEFKSRLSKEVKIDKMLFFGSLARGKGHKYSDIDLVIVSPQFKGKDFRDRPLGFYRYWDLKIPFDFLCYTPEEFNRMKKQATIVRQAAKEGIII